MDEKEVSQKGVSKTREKYESPKIEIIEVVVEKGFADSNKRGSINPGGDPNSSNPHDSRSW
jgi:hypothetical protein